MKKLDKNIVKRSLAGVITVAVVSALAANGIYVGIEAKKRNQGFFETADELSREKDAKNTIENYPGVGQIVKEYNYMSDYTIGGNNVYITKHEYEYCDEHTYTLLNPFSDKYFIGTDYVYTDRNDNIHADSDKYDDFHNEQYKFKKGDKATLYTFEVKTIEDHIEKVNKIGGIMRVQNGNNAPKYYVLVSENTDEFEVTNYLRGNKEEFDAIEKDAKTLRFASKSLLN